VTSVEVKDVIIPNVLQDAMSRQAQAESERMARVTFATAGFAPMGLIPVSGERKPD
jgi:regulator of protease activity HflC (stomatin/prohibitin superfamily)